MKQLFYIISIVLNTSIVIISLGIRAVFIIVSYYNIQHVSNDKQRIEHKEHV